MQRLRRFVTFVAFAYPACLVAAALMLRFASQRFWQVELAVYAPRLVFALPLPFLVLALLLLRLRRALWSQLAAAWVIAFPMMGLVLPGLPARAGDAHKTLRILSYNGNFAYGGQAALAAQVMRLAPDVVVFQQLFNTKELTQLLAGRYHELRTDGEFFIASRFPIRSTSVPAMLPLHGRERTPRFIQYRLDTNIGELALYSIHPVSPLYQIQAARDGGLRRAIASGTLFSPARRDDLMLDTERRALQVATSTGLARRETLPVIIAGDTNLPQLSAALSNFDGFQDGFAEAGSGFGYTFPTRHPWMRIDRIFASKQLRFLSFGVGSSDASDHLCVVAELEARAAR
jgi:vancomycin resistance protein VanJ